MFQDIYDLYSSAAYEFPEEQKKWMPEWFTGHEAFKQVKNSRIFKIFSIFGLKDFRETFIDDRTAINNLRDFMLTNLHDTDVAAAHDISRAPSLAVAHELHGRNLFDLREVIVGLIQELKNPAVWSQEKHRITRQIASSDKKLRIDAGTSVIKAYNFVRNKAQSLNVNTLPNLETTEQFRHYSRRGNISVVFSTTPTDIATMSSRSNWDNNCQVLKVQKGLNACVVGSTLSKFVGIAYITSGQQYEGRGEHMIARCLIRFAVDTQTNKPAILMDKLYPGENKTYERMILIALQKRTGILVHNLGQEGEVEDFARFRTPEEKIPGLMQHEKSYMDNAEMFTRVPVIVRDPQEFIRDYANEFTAWVSSRIHLFLSKRYKEFNDPDNDYDDEDERQIRPRALARMIVRNIIEKPRQEIYQYYRQKQNPMSSKLIKKILSEELSKSIQKTRIKENVYGYLMQLKTDFGSEFHNLLKELSEFIYNQLINIPEDFVI